MTSPTLTRRIEVSLRTGEPVEIADLEATVTLVEADTDLIVGPDGRSYHTTTGIVRFERGEESEDVEFQAGRAFEHWGHGMAFFGVDSFELSIFPPGVTVQP